DELAFRALGCCRRRERGLAALYFLSKKLVDHVLVKDLETFKADIAHRNALASTRIEHLRSLWEAILRYGDSVRVMAYGTDDEVTRKEAYARIDDLKHRIQEHGIFVGRRKLEGIIEQIYEPFLQELVKVRNSPEERDRWYSEFLKRWIEVLDEL